MSYKNKEKPVNKGRTTERQKLKINQPNNDKAVSHRWIAKTLEIHGIKSDLIHLIESVMPTRKYQDVAMDKPHPQFLA